MSGTLSGMFFPISAIIFSFLLILIYFIKKRVNLLENKYYSFILVLIFLESISSFSLQLIAVDGINHVDKTLIEIINKLDFFFLILYSSFLFLYIFTISFPKIKDSINNIYIPISLIDIVAIILLLFSNIKIICSGEFCSISGFSATITYLVCGFYILNSVLVTLFNIKNVDKRYLPIFFATILIIIILIIFVINPYLVLISLTLTIINYIMYFTIENPDLKMVNELELAKNQAEKANRAKTDFLSSMSHEIRTPLNAIVGLSNIIKDSDDLEEIHEDASDVVNASNTLLEIVNGILDISRIEADKMEVIECNYRPLEEFKTLVTLAETRIGEKDIELRTKFAEDLPEVLYGDKGKVKQIITNLLTNAVKYTESGYIDFKVNCVNEDNISRLTITVKDTGRGIKKEKFDTLFTKFNRLEEDRNSTIEGTGLGLVITKALTEMMGGKIVVDSTYGEGSKFTIFLSQKIGNASNIEIEKDEISTFDGKKILIVDDNSLNIKVANKILKEFNLDIDSCESGFECLEKVNNGNSYDLILMDIMMPKMGGVETFKKLKQIDNFNTPVVALTADAIEGKANKYLEVGFNAYLSKPIDKIELNKVLDNILNNKQEEEEKEDPEVNKVIPITDDDIKELNKLINKE